MTASSQVRNVSFDAGAAARMRDGPPPAVQRGKGALPTEMQSMVERSDTIFLATYYDSPDAPPGCEHPSIAPVDPVSSPIPTLVPA